MTVGVQGGAGEDPRGHPGHQAKAGGRRQGGRAAGEHHCEVRPLIIIKRFLLLLVEQVGSGIKGLNQGRRVRGGMGERSPYNLGGCPPP